MNRIHLSRGVFGAVVGINIAAVASENAVAEWSTKPLLMPLLLAYLIVLAGFGRHIGLIAVGLASATIADVALLIPGDTAFLAGMGFFGLAQICYILAFTRLSAPRRVPFAAVGAYLAVWVGFNYTLWPLLEPFSVPIGLYSLMLLTMACLAAGLNSYTAVGGVLFVISDALIGLDIAGMDFTGRSVLIMVTYTVAQFLLVHGWCQAARFDQPMVNSSTASAPPVSRLRS